MGATWSLNSSNLPPDGRTSADDTGFSAYARTVITAMKHCDLLLADIGWPWFFQGEHACWPPSPIAELKRITADRFVAVETSGMRISANSAQSR